MNNLQRRGFNDKRRIRSNYGSQYLKSLLAQISYTGNPAHKRNPGDFGLIPPFAPRPDKTLCDSVKIFSQLTATRLLKEGVEKGLISEQTRGQFPQNIWAVDQNGNPLEAQLENRTLGTYHGYPLAMNDPFRDEVLDYWSSNERKI